MKYYILAICVLVFVFTSSVFAEDTFRVMFYNTENFFDVNDDPEKADEDFLCSSSHFWTFARYKEKQRNIAKVITAVGGWGTPALVGLCEVENDSVVYALTHNSPLRELNYRFVVSNSPDIRGIDVALLYQCDQFKLISSVSYRIRISRPTRDILHVTGKVLKGDTLDVFVCHFPSRLGGVKETEELRATVAAELRKKADSIQMIRHKPNVLIMGDFNDYPECASLISVLGAKAPSDTIGKYVNLMLPMAGDRRIGSHKFEAEWGFLDQIIVNRNLLKVVKNKTASIFSADFLLEEDKRFGGKRPFRTYSGSKYQGGYSDHLPVWVDLDLK